MGTGEVHEIDGVDHLYALAPAEFTAARNALVKQLRAEGRKDDAASVAALRKPPATAWALNQAARTDPDLVAAALEAGAALRAATDAAMAGAPEELREATTADRTASGALVAAALERLDGGGGAGADTRLAATVRAAVLDDDVARDLRRGTVTADHDRSGLGLGAELDAWLAPAPTARHLRAVPDPPTETDDVEAGPAQPARGRSIAARRAAEREAKEAARRAAEEQARRDEADRAHRRVVNELRAEASKAAKRAARLDRAATEAEADAADARADADEAAAAAERATQALDEAVAGPPPDG